MPLGDSHYANYPKFYGSGGKSPVGEDSSNTNHYNTIRRELRPYREPNAATKLAGRGCHKYAVMDFKGALELFEKSLAMNAECFIDWDLLGDVRSMVGNFLGAINAYEKELGNYPRNPIVWKRMGWIKHLLKDGDGAIKALERALELNPNDRQTIDYLAIVKSLQKSGEPTVRK